MIGAVLAIGLIALQARGRPHTSTGWKILYGLGVYIVTVATIFVIEWLVQQGPGFIASIIAGTLWGAAVSNRGSAWLYSYQEELNHQRDYNIGGLVLDDCELCHPETAPLPQ